MSPGVNPRTAQEAYALLLVAVVVLGATLLEAGRSRGGGHLTRALRDLSYRHRHTVLGVIVIALMVAIVLSRRR
jgi:hypothetical protein